MSNARLKAYTFGEDDALGGAKTFKDALLNILTIDAVAEQVEFVDVIRGEMPVAEIHLSPSGDLRPRPGMHLFNSDDRNPIIMDGMIERIALYAGTIHRVRDRLKKIERSVEAKKAAQAAMVRSVKTGRDQ